MLKKRKKIISWALAFICAVCFTAPIGQLQASAATTGSGEITSSGNCIYFGSYPQTEIVGEASQSGAYGKVWASDSDYEVNTSLYAQLQSAEYDANGDTTAADGQRYHRINGSEATCTESGDSYYNWSDTSTFHYFRYEPIKWRVLGCSSTDAFLLADTTLDCQIYGGRSWEGSSIRAWLGENFTSRAFTEAEQKAITKTEVVNGKNMRWSTGAGNNTEDKVFLLSDSEARTEAYGFTSSADTDTFRVCKGSAYAKAMGIFNNCLTEGQIGTCPWWLRTSGYEPSHLATWVTHWGGNIDEYGNEIDWGHCGVRPALYLNLENTQLYTTDARTITASDVKLSQSTFKYDGKKHQPTVTISGLTSGTDYIVSYTNNTKVGTATVTITGKGNFTGTVSKTFKINPATASVKSLTSGKKKLTVKMTARPSTKGAGYYQIAYKQKGTSKWKYTTTSSYSKTIKSLKKGKYYYVKARAFKKVSGKTYYGAWSKTRLSKKIK